MFSFNKTVTVCADSPRPKVSAFHVRNECNQTKNVFGTFFKP